MLEETGWFESDFQAARSGLFFKQWGGWGVDGKKRGKKQNGRLLDVRTWDAVPRKERRQQELVA